MFDGPYRPSFKRGIKIAPHAACLDNFLTKQLLKCFGFPFHDAPGEAEAECAFLQKEGIVDAVLSEDVDTLMFGCTLSLRNWNAEGNRGNKSPTHVDVHRSERTLAKSGLDSDGMILVALMRGGDYIQAGIPKCGIVIACQAARAGFGKELCELAKGDDASLQGWRQRLKNELRTNRSGFFSKKCQAIDIPESFPDKKVLGYYQTPIISSTDKVRSLRGNMVWDAEVNVAQLREFVAEAFNWPCLVGAKHFIRGLAPVLLARKLVQRGRSDSTDRETMGSKAIAEANLVRTIHGRRAHWVTDGEPELRVEYIPVDVVGLDLDAEEIDSIEPVDSDENSRDTNNSAEEARRRPGLSTKRPFTYDPTQIEKVWVLETFAKFGAPLLVETWEEDMRDPKKFAARKARERTALAEDDSQKGAMEKFVKIRKPIIGREGGKLAQLPPVSIGSDEHMVPTSPQKRALQENRRGLDKIKPLPKRERPKNMNEQSSETKSPRVPEAHQNPWTLAKKASRENLSQLEPDGEPRIPSEMGSLLLCKERGRSPSPLNASHGFITQRSNARKTKHIRSTSASCTGAKTLRTSEPEEEMSTLKEPTSAGPSPKKKRNLFQAANELHATRQPPTPESVPEHKERPQQPTFIEKFTSSSKSPKRVNRKLDFKAASGPHLPASDSISELLPSPSALLSPPHSQPISKEPEVSVRGKDLVARKRSNIKSLVAVRESLEGAWKQLEPWEAEKLDKARRVYSSVEVVNLTSV